MIPEARLQEIESRRKDWIHVNTDEDVRDLVAEVRRLNDELRSLKNRYDGRGRTLQMRLKWARQLREQRDKALADYRRAALTEESEER